MRLLRIRDIQRSLESTKTADGYKETMFVYVYFYENECRKFDCSEQPAWLFAHPEEVVAFENNTYRPLFTEFKTSKYAEQTAPEKPDVPSLIAIEDILFFKERHYTSTADTLHQYCYVKFQNRDVRRYDTHNFPIWSAYIKKEPDSFNPYQSMNDIPLEPREFYAIYEPKSDDYLPLPCCINKRMCQKQLDAYTAAEETPDTGEKLLIISKITLIDEINTVNQTSRLNKVAHVLFSDGTAAIFDCYEQPAWYFARSEELVHLDEKGRYTPMLLPENSPIGHRMQKEFKNNRFDKYLHPERKHEKLCLIKICKMSAPENIIMRTNNVETSHPHCYVELGFPYVQLININDYPHWAFMRRGDQAIYDVENDLIIPLPHSTRQSYTGTEITQLSAKYKAEYLHQK